MKWNVLVSGWMSPAIAIFWCFTRAMTGDTTEIPQVGFPAGRAVECNGVHHRVLRRPNGADEPAAVQINQVEQRMAVGADLSKSVALPDAPLFFAARQVRKVWRAANELEHRELRVEQRSSGPKTHEAQAPVVREPSRCTYYRLEEGKTWTYRVSFADDRGMRRPLENVTVKNVGSEELEGKKVTVQIYNRLGPHGPTRFYTGFVGQDANGVYELASQSASDTEPKLNRPPRYIIRCPVKVGRTWREKEKTHFLAENVEVLITYAVESADEVLTVPAGEFRNCLMMSYRGALKRHLDGLGVVNITVEQRAWFAPRVGLVKSVRKEKSSGAMKSYGELKTELVAYR